MALNRPARAAGPALETTFSAAPAPTTETTATQAAKDPGFYLKVEPNEANIGDSVAIHLQAHNPNFSDEKIDEVSFDPDEKQWTVTTPWQRDAAPQTSGKPAAAWHAVLRPFETGQLTIPATKIVYQNAQGQKVEAQTTTATLKVNSIRPANSKQLTLIGLRDPAPIARDFGWLWTLGGVITLLGLLGWWVFRWWRRRHLAPVVVAPEPELPPGLWAVRELNRRSQLPVCQTGPAKAIYSHVSEVIRLYLGRRYGVNAIDMTTMECLRALHVLQPGDDVLRWIQKFLDECDLIKFTTHEVARERWKMIWHDARMIVQMTTPAEELGIATANGDQSLGQEVAI